MANYLFIDIETIPKTLADYERAELLAKPRKWIGHLKREQTDQEVIDNLSLHPCKFQIVAISVLAKSGWATLSDFADAGPDESKLLHAFADFINSIRKNHGRDWHFGGHNIKEFDLPRLALACVRHGVGPIAEYFLKATRDENTIDTCAFPGWRPSLKDLELEIFQSMEKTDDGKNMQQLVADGEWDRIRLYCKTDTRIAFCVAAALGLVESGL